MAVAVVAVVAAAGPFRPADLPAETKWWAHLDVERFNATEVGRSILDTTRTEKAERKLTAFREVFGFDPRTDIEGITVAGAGRRSAVIVRGRFDAKRLVTLIRAGDGYEERVVAGRTIHSWIDEKKARKEGADKARVFGAHHPSGALVISEHETVVARVLAVMDGQEPALAAAVHGLPTAAVVVAAMDGETAATAKNPLLESARRGVLSAREEEGKVVADLEVEFGDASVAEKVGQILLGIQAAALLGVEKEPAAAKLASSARVRVEGALVSLALKVPAADIVAEIRRAAEKKKDADR